MNQDNSDSRDFRPDYTVLELNDRADWKSARANYRRLVHLWHPDRYAQRPRERAHAQQQFITLTKSYTRLRNFQKRHDRLPFESTVNRSTNETMATHTHKSRKTRQQTHDQTAYSSNPDLNTSDTAFDVTHGALSREQTDRKPMLAPKLKTRIIWTFASCAIILATLSVFFLLDRKANQAVMERGREVLRDAPPSDFMPTTAEIRRSEAKGAFVQPTK